MNQHRSPQIWGIFFTALFLFCLPLPASAYVGPGAGLGFVNVFFALAAAVGIALLTILIWPIRMMMKKMRAKKAGDSNQQEPKP